MHNGSYPQMEVMVLSSFISPLIPRIVTSIIRGSNELTAQEGSKSMALSGKNAHGK